MRNIALAVMLAIGLVNVDRIYYHGALLKPALSMLWRSVQDWV